MLRNALSCNLKFAFFLHATSFENDDEDKKEEEKAVEKIKESAVVHDTSINKK